jgi:uncharacterized membrane protein YqjE
VSDPSSGGAGSGILQSLRNLAATLLALLQTRFELLVAELEEERMRLLQLLFWIAGAIFFLAVGILLLVILLVAVFWESHRLAAIVVLAGVFLAAGAGMSMMVRKLMRERPRLFSTSLGELAKDRDQLTPR